MAEQKPLTEAEVAELRKDLALTGGLTTAQCVRLIADWERLRLMIRQLEISSKHPPVVGPIQRGEGMCADPSPIAAERDALRSLAGELVGIAAEYREALRGKQVLGSVELFAIGRCNAALARAAEMGVE